MSLFELTREELTGRASTHVVRLENPPCVLHREVVAPFRALRAAAAAAGIDLMPVSGFRDFERQLLIWNAKSRGERPLHDRDGALIDYDRLDPATRVDTILLWSALPGASRHHWASELDVVDAAVLAPGQRPPLLPQAYAAGGVFAHLETWLAANLQQFGFHRPYARDLGGVQPEPWHISYGAVAEAALAALTAQLLREVLECSPIEDKAAVLARLPEIHERYVRNVEPAPAQGALRDPTRLS